MLNLSPPDEKPVPSREPVTPAEDAPNSDVPMDAPQIAPIGLPDLDDLTAPPADRQRAEFAGDDGKRDVPFTDDAARNRYAANSGTWASQDAAPVGPAPRLFSSSAILWVAVVSFAIGVGLSRL